MEGAGLGGARRTHYTDGLAAGERVTVMGWVMAVRGHGAISFVTLRDRRGEAQIVAKSGACADELVRTASSLRPHSSISVTGTVQDSPKAPRGVEIVPESIGVLSSAEAIAPFEPHARTVKNIDTRLELRAIDLRRPALQDVFHARSRVLRAVRRYMDESDFTEVHTPKLIKTATEGGAALFSIFYYNRSAHLAQSPQLYKEQLTMSLEKVYEIGPIFRAEPSRTQRHLSEAISIDIEEAFVDHTDIMDRADAIVHAAADAAREGAPESMRVPDVPERIPRFTYEHMIDRLKDAGVRAAYGDDLHAQSLRRAGIEGFYFVTDWPLGPKPFYVRPSESDARASDSFDLMYGDLEISSGSARISDREQLAARMKAKGMSAESFDYHLRVFDYGMPPHAGCGIGLERLMMALTGTTDIRDAAFYPRDIDRLTP